MLNKIASTPSFKPLSTLKRDFKSLTGQKSAKNITIAAISIKPVYKKITPKAKNKAPPTRVTLNLDIVRPMKPVSISNRNKI